MGAQGSDVAPRALYCQDQGHHDHGGRIGCRLQGAIVHLHHGLFQPDLVVVGCSCSAVLVFAVTTFHAFLHVCKRAHWVVNLRVSNTFFAPLAIGDDHILAEVRLPTGLAVARLFAPSPVTPNFYVLLVGRRVVSFHFGFLRLWA